jgi:hypothetical protein
MSFVAQDNANVDVLHGERVNAQLFIWDDHDTASRLHDETMSAFYASSHAHIKHSNLLLHDDGRVIAHQVRLHTLIAQPFLEFCRVHELTQHLVGTRAPLAQFLVSVVGVTINTRLASGVLLGPPCW